ncbi:MAG: hypothetical protein JWO82_1845 [Akkermansiaceae bacterium]|nr:hypothetical protein [Akkermansiaceae bacterium]
MMIEDGEKTTFHMPTFMKVLYTFCGLGMAVMAWYYCSAYSTWRNQAWVPNDKEAILQSLAIQRKPAEVFECKGEDGPRPLWIRMQLPKEEVPQVVLKNEKLMADLRDVENSSFEVDHSARSLILYERDKEDTWVPEGFFLKSGYEGDRRAVALYESEDSPDALVIVHLTL